MALSGLNGDSPVIANGGSVFVLGGALKTAVREYPLVPFDGSCSTSRMP